MTLRLTGAMFAMQALMLAALRFTGPALNRPLGGAAADRRIGAAPDDLPTPRRACPPSEPRVRRGRQRRGRSGAPASRGEGASTGAPPGPPPSAPGATQISTSDAMGSKSARKCTELLFTMIFRVVGSMRSAGTSPGRRAAPCGSRRGSGCRECEATPSARGSCARRRTSAPVPVTRPSPTCSTRNSASKGASPGMPDLPPRAMVIADPAPAPCAASAASESTSIPSAARGASRSTSARSIPVVSESPPRPRVVLGVRDDHRPLGALRESRSRPALRPPASRASPRTRPRAARSRPRSPTPRARRSPASGRTRTRGAAVMDVRGPGTPPSR